MIFVRGVMSALLIGGVVLALGHAQQLRGAMSRLLAARSVCDGLSTAGFIAALAHHEARQSRRRAADRPAPDHRAVGRAAIARRSAGGAGLAIGIGFIGALLVIKPVPSAFNVWAIVGAGVRAVRGAARNPDPRASITACRRIVIAFWGAVAITLFGLFFAVTEDWRMFAAGDLLQLFVAAVFVGIAIYLLALGFRDVDLSVVAPFRYSYLLTSAIGGYLVFRELPDGWTVVGAALIVGSGIYTLHREAVRRRALTAEGDHGRVEAA